MKEKWDVKKFLFVLVVFLFGMGTVNAAKNPYKPTSQFGPNCTWNAWNQTYKRLGIALPAWGNANTWYDYAKKAGFEVGKTPRNNSIAVWEWDKYGHVAFVEKVSGDKIYVWESDAGCIDTENEEYKTCIENGVSEETDRACAEKYGKRIGCEKNASYWQVPGDLIGYIYLDKVPSKPAAVTTTKPAAATTSKKSNNAYLSSIKVSDIDFTFKKETLDYELVVENELEKVTVDATTDHAKAKVEGVGEYPLNIGENTIKLVVMAEDSTKKTYTIKIKRKDNNAYLSNLTISAIDFVFDKNTFEYEFQVSRELERVQIDATTESEFSTLEGTGNYPLMEEETTINLVVTAEDETKNSYTIHIKKEPIVEKSILKKKDYKWLIIGSVVAFVILISIVAFVIIKKRKNRK